MSIYIKVSNTWVELTGDLQPKANVNGSWLNIANGYAKVAGVWQQIYQYDILPPNVNAPSVVDSITTQTISWNAISDTGSGVVTGTLYQIFVGSVTGPISGSTFSLSSFGAGSTIMSIPNNRRQQGISGEQWYTYYYISVTKNGIITVGPSSPNTYTSPYDIAGPVVGTPSVSNQVSTNYVTWAQITDAVSSIASAKIYQVFTSTTSAGDVTQESPIEYTIASPASTISMSIDIPLNKRQQGTSGTTFTVKYYIIATDSLGNTTTSGTSTAIATTAYDITGPVVGTPSVTNSITTNVISWTEITDAVSSVTSVKLYQVFTSTTSASVVTQESPIETIISPVTTTSISLSIPDNKRQQGISGNTFTVKYYIVASDSFGNITTGPTSTAIATTAYDIVGPVVGTPSVVNGVTTQTVSWSLVTDAVSTVSSVKLYQVFTRTNGTEVVVAGEVPGATTVYTPVEYTISPVTLLTYNAPIPNDRRQQGINRYTWTAKYYIIATDSLGNTRTGSTSTAVATTAYDIVAPVVSAPSVVSGGSSDVITWGAITDTSTITAANLYQAFYNVNNSTWEPTYAISSLPLSNLSGGSVTMNIPTARRNNATSTGNISATYYMVAYWIAVTDVYNNTDTNWSGGGRMSTLKATKPLGTFKIPSNAADARNIGDTAWLNHDSSDEGVVGISTTKKYGAWFYPTSRLYNSCRTWTPDSSFIFLQRPGSLQPNRGDSGTFTIRGHTSPTKVSGTNGALSFTGTITTYISGNDGTSAPALSSGMLTNIANGTIEGFALTDHSTSGIGFLRGLTSSSSNNPYGLTSGDVWLTFD